MRLEDMIMRQDYYQTSSKETDEMKSQRQDDMSYEITQQDKSRWDDTDEKRCEEMIMRQAVMT